MRPRREDRSARSKFEVSWAWTSTAPSITSPIRPAKARAASTRFRFSSRIGLRSLGMRKAWPNTTAAATRPSQMLCTMMKAMAVKARPPRNAGAMKASPMKPPSGSTSSLIMVAISACLSLRTCRIGKRRMRSLSS